MLKKTEISCHVFFAEIGRRVVSTPRSSFPSWPPCGGESPRPRSRAPTGHTQDQGARYSSKDRTLRGNRILVTELKRILGAMGKCHKLISSILLRQIGLIVVSKQLFQLQFFKFCNCGIQILIPLHYKTLNCFIIATKNYLAHLTNYGF